jgi:two-component system OmpR family response regulator
MWIVSSGWKWGPRIIWQNRAIRANCLPGSARCCVAARKAKRAPAVSFATGDGEHGRGLRFAGWRIDIDARMLYDPDDRVISLTDGEFRLLRAFVERPRRVLTRDQLLDFARGEDSEHYDRAIDVQISRLRRKLSEGQNGDELIRTVRNEGYLFVPAVSKA